ncbi:MAG: GlsB/YeaQ/YmgE family stress response membrane protein [Paracoccaceae bacterium]
MAIVYLLIIGAAAGFLATRALNVEADIPTTVAIGVGGALVGWVVWRFLLVVTGWLGGFVAALGGAFLLVWLYRRYFSGRP